MYVSTEEAIGEELKIDRISPTALYCDKAEKRFVRRKGAITFTVGRKTIPTWFGKRLTAYTHMIEEDEIVNIGSLYKALEYVLGDKVKSLKDDVKTLLIESHIYVTAELDSIDKSEELKPLTESNINDEAKRNMARLIAEGVEDMLRHEDW